MRSFTNPICGRGWGGRILGGAAKCKQSTSIQSNDYQTRPRGRLSHNLVCVDDSFQVLETPVGIGLSHTLGRIGTVSSRDARRRGGSENGGETDATSLSAGRFGYVYSTGRNSVKTPPYPQKPQSGASDAAPVINDDVMFLWVAFGGGARLDAVAWVQTTLLALASSVSSSTSPQRRGPRPGAGPEDPRSMLEKAERIVQALLYLFTAEVAGEVGGEGGGVAYHVCCHIRFTGVPPFPRRTIRHGRPPSLPSLPQRRGWQVAAGAAMVGAGALAASAATSTGVGGNQQQQQQQQQLQPLTEDLRQAVLSFAAAAAPASTAQFAGAALPAAAAAGAAWRSWCQHSHPLGMPAPTCTCTCRGCRSPWGDRGRGRGGDRGRGQMERARAAVGSAHRQHPPPPPPPRHQHQS